MAQNALNIVLQTDGSTAATLAERWELVFENLSKTTLASLLKNQNLSGDPTAGVLNVRRFANAVEKAYGTARQGREGDKVQANTISINIDDNKEWLEEVEAKDLMMFGVNGLIERRTANQENAIRRYLERKFFNTATLAGAVHTLTGSTIEDKIEEMIQKVETVSNDFVDGVDRGDICIILRPSIYGAIRNHIDDLNNANISSNVESVGMFHGVLVASSVYLPATVDYLVMTYGATAGAVAQPIRYSIYNPKQVEFSEATAFGAFTYGGHKAVASDLIFFAGTLGAVTAASTAGSSGTTTTITVTSAKSDAANEFYYLAGATAVAAPTYGDAVGATWTKLVLTSGAQAITTGTATKIRVAEADASGRIIKTTAELTIVNGN